MKLYYDLYLDDISKSKKEEIINKILKCSIQFQVHLITLAKNEKNHLEIFDSNFLKQKRINYEDLFVIGIASSYHSALEIVEKLTQEVYDNTEDTNIRQYVLQKQEMFEKGNV